MKKKIITIIVLSFLSVVFLSAKEKAFPMPSKGSVTLVGRINFSSRFFHLLHLEKIEIKYRKKRTATK